MIAIVKATVAEVFASPQFRPLIAEYAAECSISEMGVIDPQEAVYQQIENAGILQFFTAMDGVRMVGLASVLTSLIPHYSRSAGVVESLFLEKRCRNTRTGLHLMDAIENHARQKGCPVVLYTAPVGGALEKLLARRKNTRKTNATFCRTL